jgi:hypothetical protein
MFGHWSKQNITFIVEKNYEVGNAYFDKISPQSHAEVAECSIEGGWKL